MKIFTLSICLLSLSLFANSGKPEKGGAIDDLISESECQTIAEKSYFEMTTGFIGCNTTSVMASSEDAKLVNGKCEFKVVLQQMQTEMGCGNGPQIHFEPGYPIAVRKFNRRCKKAGFRRIKKERNEYGERVITCRQK